MKGVSIQYGVQIKSFILIIGSNTNINAFSNTHSNETLNWVQRLTKENIFIQQPRLQHCSARKKKIQPLSSKHRQETLTSKPFRSFLYHVYHVLKVSSSTLFTNSNFVSREHLFNQFLTYDFWFTLSENPSKGLNVNVLEKQSRTTMKWKTVFWESLCRILTFEDPKKCTICIIIHRANLINFLFSSYGTAGWHLLLKKACIQLKIDVFQEILKQFHHQNWNYCNMLNNHLLEKR